MRDLPMALDLFFQYYLKRPDLYMQFYHAINIYYKIKKDSYLYGYFTQINFFEKLKEYSLNWSQDLITLLFVQIAENFIKLEFSSTEGGRKNAFTMYQFSLVMSDGVEEYRGLIWQYLHEISMTDKYANKIRNVLKLYGGYFKDINTSVVEFDLEYIKKIIHSSFLPSELVNCILADKIMQTLKRMKILCDDKLFSDYFIGEDFNLYKILRGPTYFEIEGYDEREIFKKNKIEKYVFGCDFEKIKRLIDICKELKEFDEDNKEFGEVANGLRLLFETIWQRKKFYIETIDYYIENDTPYNIYPYYVISNLFSLLPSFEVFELINKYEYNQKNLWIFAYYRELPQDNITEIQLNSLYDFFSDSSDNNINFSANRNIDFLDKYKVIDNDAFVKSCKIILKKKNYSLFMVSIYFASMFNYYYNSPENVIQKFSEDLKLLEDIYITMLSYDSHHDHDGRFLKEIYKVSSSILDKYLDCLIEDNKIMKDYDSRLKCFFELENFDEIFDMILNKLISNCRFSHIRLSYFLEDLLLHREDENEQELNQNKAIWVRHYINTFHFDSDKMYCLFSSIAKLKTEQKIEYIKQFFESNPNFEDFKKLPLTPQNWSASGSFIPVYSSWIDFLKILLPIFTGIKWLSHRKHIEDKIDCLEKQIKNEQIKEILIG